jgi:hypothetical protein
LLYCNLAADVMRARRVRRLNWLRACAVLSFARANASQPFRDSVLALLPTILAAEGSGCAVATAKGMRYLTTLIPPLFGLDVIRRLPVTAVETLRELSMSALLETRFARSIAVQAAISAGSNKAHAPLLRRSTCP